MAGGGLKLTNLAEVVRRTGVSYLHGSLTRKPSDRDETNGKPAGNGHLAVSRQSMLEADVRESIRLLSYEVVARESATQTAG
jgi:copper homeostasis protein CutC